MAWADSPRGVDPLRQVPVGELAKPARKTLRRAHHRLRSRGIEIAEEAAPARVATLPELADELTALRISPPDPSGAQLVIRIEPSPSGGARIVQGAVDLERGILEFQVLPATRSQARRLLRELEASPRLAATPATGEALAALLARAAAVQPPDRALPPAFEESRSRIARPAAADRSPGELAREALAASADLSAARRVAERVAAGEIGPWPPPFETLREIAEKVRQTGESPLLVNEPQRRAQVESVVGDALDARYDGKAGEATALRLEECAHSAWKAGREQEARDLLSAAFVFRERAPRDNPVARALLDRVLGPMLEALRQERSSSLLVKP
jgi:hypothetical protein